ncbi:unnamed protein product [Lota lota]
MDGARSAPGALPGNKENQNQKEMTGVTGRNLERGYWGKHPSIKLKRRPTAGSISDQHRRAQPKPSPLLFRTTDLRLDFRSMSEQRLAARCCHGYDASAASQQTAGQMNVNVHVSLSVC